MVSIGHSQSGDVRIAIFTVNCSDQGSIPWPGTFFGLIVFGLSLDTSCNFRDGHALAKLITKGSEGEHEGLQCGGFEGWRCSVRWMVDGGGRGVPRFPPPKRRIWEVREERFTPKKGFNKIIKARNGFLIALLSAESASIQLAFNKVSHRYGAVQPPTILETFEVGSIDTREVAPCDSSARRKVSSPRTTVKFLGGELPTLGH